MTSSNLLQYLNSFFDSLEIFEDKERGHHYKAYLRESISQFLKDESPANAYEVYRVFFDSYRINMPGKEHAFLDIVNILRDYEENAAGLIDKQRDHFVHSVNVFITGLCIFASNSKYREAFAKAVPEPEYQNAYPTKNEEFFYRWGLASLLHDIGYPVEIIGNQINKYIGIVADADGDEFKVKAKISYSDFAELNRIKEVIPKPEFAACYCDAYGFENIEYLTPIDLMSGRICRTFGCDFEAVRSALGGFVELMGNAGFIDHGYYSALILTKWYAYQIQSCGYKPEYFFWPVLDSATAILLHNWWRNGLQKAPFGCGPMDASKNPVAYLLILCDELQEWNRTARGIITKTFILASGANFSFRDGYLSVAYITERGSLPKSFVPEKIELLRRSLNIDEVFPNGLYVDNMSNDSLAELKQKLSAAPNPLLENVERLALATHMLYNEKRLAEHPDEPLAYPNFTDLPDDLKYSNMRQARSVFEKLNAFGYTLEPKKYTGYIEKLPDDVIEKLAYLEHDDWVQERISLGWTLGPKDVEKKVTPYLVPYDELSEEIKDYDRDVFRNIPKLAELIGMAIYEI